MDSRILVAYDTRSGSTVEVAKAIAEVLAARGILVDVKPVKEKPKVDSYQAVLVGSAIRFGAWLPEAVEFVKTNQAALNQVPVAVFTTHILNLGEDGQSRTNRLAYLAAVRPLLKPVAEVFFAGRLDPEKLSLVERLISRMVKAPEGDLRDWEKIRGWGQIIFT